MAKFELRRLENYDDTALLAELRRVAALVDSLVLTRSEFDRHSKASASLLGRRFGGWARALDRAGLSDRFSGTPKAKRILARGARTFSDDELLAELRAVAAKLGTNIVTVEQFNQHGAMNAETIRRRFGSWWRATKRADLKISNRGKRYSDSEYFENLLRVWKHYGRQPTYGEMDRSPSTIRAKAYEAKWGKWRSALKAFLERVDSDVAASAERREPSSRARGSRTSSDRPSRSRKVSSAGSSRRQGLTLGLRYDVLRRDRFRCVICGVSPALRLGCELHVDHVTPISQGGRNVLENLRTLCSECNLGKGAKVEREPVS